MADLQELDSDILARLRTWQIANALELGARNELLDEVMDHIDALYDAIVDLETERDHAERFREIALSRMRNVAATNQAVLRALEAWSDRVPYLLLRRVRTILTTIDTAPAVNAVRAEEAAKIAGRMLRNEDEKTWVFRRAARWLEGKQK